MTTGPFCWCGNRPPPLQPVLALPAGVQLACFTSSRRELTPAPHATVDHASMPHQRLCHLGVARTLSMLERFYWWIGMNISTRWWLRHCLQCQERKSSRQTTRWPILSLPLPSGPGIAISVDCFDPLPVTPKGTYTLLSRPFQVARRRVRRFCGRIHDQRAPQTLW